MKKKKVFKRILWLCLVIFILMNVVAFFHAYKFTHFAEANSASKTKSPEKLSSFDKIKTLALGVSNPKPVNTITPAQPFKTIQLQSNKLIECWSIKTDSSKGTVILFHGYSGEKSSLIERSDEFIKQGFSTVLVDFMGSGGSQGNQTTIGFKEAEEVKTVFEYCRKEGDKNIYLFGTSMGAAAIMKAINDHQLDPKAIIIECPFGSMYQTTCARFNNMSMPSFPMAGLLVFWGGMQNGFWAFGHNPSDYAKNINCPVLLMYGEKDTNVSRKEIDDIFSRLNGKKQLKTYPLAGHENFLLQYKQQWILDINSFLQTSSN
jgi:uncharacterized protein